MNKNNPMNNLVYLFRLEQDIQRAKLEGNYQFAIQIYDEIISIKQNLPNKMGLVKSITQKAFLLEQLGFPQDALHSYYSAVEIAKISPNKQYVNEIVSHINRITS
jgi:tetratricopeptide (TPR) repeat protein